MPDYKDNDIQIELIRFECGKITKVYDMQRRAELIDQGRIGVNIRHFAGGYGIHPYESHPQGRIL